MSRRGVVIAGCAAGALLLLLVLSQLLLPGVAERRLRDDLRGEGEVMRVEVSAFPALKVLWGRADRVEVRMRSYESDTGRLADFLARTDRTGELDARTAELRAGGATLRDARLTKRGDALHGEAVLTESALREALPPGLDVRPVASGGGELVLEGSATALGTGLALRARLLPVDGALRIQPDAIFGGLLSLSVFSDPRVEITGVGARSVAGGFRVSADADLR